MDKTIVFNGINGATGEYGLPPMTGAELSSFIRGEAPPKNLAELRHKYRSKTLDHLGPKEGVDPKRLDEAGWGVIFAHNVDPAVKQALGPLIAHRKAQAGDYFRSCEGPDGFRSPDDTKSAFLARHGVGPGPADPARMPYYLLIVGSPEVIPFRFQYELDVQYAVGRIDFDTPEEYASYAASVVAAEQAGAGRARRAAFFGVSNPDDQMTALCASRLVEPLASYVAGQGNGWEVSTILRDQATRARLEALLGGPDTPSLLFTASHGMEFPLDDRRQLPYQGALLCQDWPGPQASPRQQPIPREYYFAGEDLAAQADLRGMIAFLFACYGAGTPLLDDFSRQAFKERMAIAPRAFTADLPKKLLGRPAGGALAVVGHIERVWSYSFDWPDARPSTVVFESTLRRLLEGHPVGSAVEYFNERWAELATVLSGELEDIEFGKTYDPYSLSDLWTANNDARSYVVIGDPAVRLPAAVAPSPGPPTAP